MEEGKYCLNRCSKFNMVTLLPPGILLIISFQVTYLEIYCVCFHSYLTMISKKKLLMSYYLRSERQSDLNKMKTQRQTQIMIMSSFCLFFNILMKKNLGMNLLLGRNCGFFWFFLWVFFQLQQSGFSFLLSDTCPLASLFPFSLHFLAFPVSVMNLCLGEKTRCFQAK